MPKKIIQDVIPKTKGKSNILSVESRPFVSHEPKNNTEKRNKTHSHKERETPGEPRHIYEDEQIVYPAVLKHETTEQPEKVPSRAKKILWTIASIAILVLFFTVSASFATVSVDIKPKRTDIKLNESISITKGGPADSFHYEVVTKEKIGTKKIPAKGQEKVSKKAIGTVTIFNSFSSASIRLVRNTRITSGDGRVYRLNDSVVVPGASIQNGTTLPGSKDAVVSADSPGDSFNLNIKDLKGDFTFPSYAGTSKFKTVVARQKTDIVGGFVGTVPTILPEDRKAGLAQLFAELSDQAFKEIYSEIPEQFSLFNKAYTVSTSTLADLKSDDSDFGVIQAKVTLRGALFNNKTLANVFANREKITMPKGPITFVPGADFNVTVQNINGGDWWIANGGYFTFSGNGTLESIVDTNKLRDQLTGISKNSFESVRVKHPEIESASVAFHPIWALSFPDKAQNIRISVGDLQEK